MAQLRHDYSEFVARDAEILVVGPDKPDELSRYWQERRLPFVGLPDPEHEVAELYGQEVNLLKLGRMPAQMVIDKSGQIRYAHYGHSMMDIPPNDDILSLLDQLNREGRESNESSGSRSGSVELTGDSETAEKWGHS